MADTTHAKKQRTVLDEEHRIEGMASGRFNSNNTRFLAKSVGSIANSNRAICPLRSRIVAIP
jgi:hypothetical protein